MSQQLELVSNQLQAMQVMVIHPLPFICEYCGGDHVNGICEPPYEDFYMEDFVCEQHAQRKFCEFWGGDHPNDYYEDDVVLNMGQRGSFTSPYGDEKEPWEIAIEKLAVQTSSFMEETRASFRNQEITFKNQENSVRNLEAQVGQLAKELKERSLGSLQSDSILNPRGVEISMLEEEYPKEEHVSREDELEEKKYEDKKMLLDEYLVWREARNFQIWEDAEVQLEIHQQINISSHHLSIKEERDKELDRLLDTLNALFIIPHLKRAWKQHHRYLKFMEFLPQKRKKKDDVFFVSYYPP